MGSKVTETREKGKITPSEVHMPQTLIGQKRPFERRERHLHKIDSTQWTKAHSYMLLFSKRGTILRATSLLAVNSVSPTCKRSANSIIGSSSTVPLTY
jgi:hypothetical protein